jgi:hypothetical protein
MLRFTVLMPTHNRADVIGYAIRTVLAQTEQDFELFVVGDGCTDETADAVTQFKDRRVRWFNFPKAPFAGYANRNLALREASGELVAYAQDDDLMLPDHLALLGQALGGGMDWAYTRPLWVTTDGIVVPYGTNLKNPDELTQFLSVGNTIPTSCVAHRRDCFDRFGYWPEDIASAADWHLWHKIVRGCGSKRIAYVPVPTTLHFSAAWKNSRHSGVDEVHTWLSVADGATWWPAALRYPIPGLAQEQRVLFEALESGGSEFVTAIRQAAVAVMDRLGWDSIRHALPRIADLEMQLSEARIALEAARTDAANLQAERDADRTRFSFIENRLAEREHSLHETMQTLHHMTQALRDMNETQKLGYERLATIERQLAERDSVLRDLTQSLRDLLERGNDLKRTSQ